MLDIGTDLDLAARRVIFAVQADVVRWCEMRQLDPELVGALYVRVRDILRRSPTDEELIDELALAVYLTVSAWTADTDRIASILPDLRRDIAESMHATKSTPNPTEEGELS
jgi:hypothetical protein